MKKNKGIFFSVFIAMFLLLLLKPFLDFPLEKFNYILGNTILNGLDISLKLKRMQCIIFVLVPIISALTYLLYNKFLKFKNSELEKYFNILSFIGIVISILKVTSSYQEVILNMKFLYLIFEMLIIIQAIDKFFKKDNIENLMPCSIISFNLTLIFTFLLQYLTNIGSIEKYFYVIFPIFIFLLLYITRKINISDRKKLYLGANVIIAFPMVYSIIFELVSLLMSRSIFINGNHIVLLYLIFSFVFIWLIYKKIDSKKSFFNYEQSYYLLFIIGITMISIQLPSQIIVDTDFFESANYGTSIYQLIKYGQIPILETYDAHMLYYQLGGILYYILSGDITGAIFNPYINIYEIFTIVLVYKLLTHFFSKKESFLAVLFLPFLSDSAICYYFLGIIPILALLKLIKTEKIMHSILFVISLIFLTLLKLDLGLMFGLSTILVLLIYILFLKKSKLAKNFVYSLIISIAGFFLLVIIISEIKNINLFKRIFEFINLSLSNVNWAYSSFGNLTEFRTILLYLILPLSVTYSLINLIIKFKNEIKSLDLRYVILIVLGFAYIFNFSRGIVRHSLIEKTYIFSVSTSIIYFGLYYSLLKEKHNSFFYFCSLYVAIVVSLNMLVTPTIQLRDNLFDESIKKYLKFENKSFYNKVEDRVILSNKMNDVYIPLKNIFDIISNEKETYLDFTNQTLLYSLMGKNKPVYINQSPGLLNNYYTQQEFLNQIKSDNNVKFALTAQNNMNLSDELDEISNNYRYYLVTEYLVNNYTPLVYSSGFYIWVKNDYKEEAISKIRNISNLNVLEEKNYSLTINNYDLKNIPYIWSFNIKEKTQNKTIVKNLSIENVFEISFDDLQKSKNGNYLNFSIEAKEESNVIINLLNEKNIISIYSFSVKKGINDYVIRVSADFNWNINNCNGISIQTDKKIIVRKMVNKIIY